jgi:hypothetical protein
MRRSFVTAAAVLFALTRLAAVDAIGTIQRDASERQRPARGHRHAARVFPDRSARTWYVEN